METNAIQITSVAAAATSLRCLAFFCCCDFDGRRFGCQLFAIAEHAFGRDEKAPGSRFVFHLLVHGFHLGLDNCGWSCLLFLHAREDSGMSCCSSSMVESVSLSTLFISVAAVSSSVDGTRVSRFDSLESSMPVSSTLGEAGSTGVASSGWSMTASLSSSIAASSLGTSVSSPSSTVIGATSSSDCYFSSTLRAEALGVARSSPIIGVVPDRKGITLLGDSVEASF
jgi:hypothetical protein